MLYLGIDQHAMQLAVCVRDESDSIILRRQVSTVPQKVWTFFDEIHEQARPLGGWVVIVEICGFNDWLLKLLEAVGCHEIIVVQKSSLCRNHRCAEIIVVQPSSALSSFKCRSQIAIPQAVCLLPDVELTRHFALDRHLAGFGRVGIRSGSLFFRQSRTSLLSLSNRKGPQTALK